MRLGFFYAFALVITGFVAGCLLSHYSMSFFAGTMVLLFPFIAAMLAAELLKHLVPGNRVGNIRLLLFSLFCSLVLIEGTLRVFRKNATYNETIGYHHYFSPYWNDKNFWYVYPPNDTFDYWRKDFRYFRVTNSLGIPERELNLADTDGTKKILCLGDSFTEGMGAPADSAWPRLLERYLNASGRDSFMVYNAGIAGSDPVYEEHLLRGRLWNVNWNTIIFCINGTDIEDCKIRGGMERFGTDSSVTYRKPPAWEPLYVASYLFRFVVDILGYDQLFFSKSQDRKFQAFSVGVIQATLMKAAKELDERGIGMLVVIHPMKGEADMKSFYNHYMDSLLYRIGDLKPLNLIPYFADSLPGKTRSEDLYWRNDNHFKPEGYRLMAEKINRELQRH